MRSYREEMRRRMLERQGMAAMHSAQMADPAVQQVAKTILQLLGGGYTQEELHYVSMAVAAGVNSLGVRTQADVFKGIHAGVVGMGGVDMQGMDGRSMGTAYGDGMVALQVAAQMQQGWASYSQQAGRNNFAITQGLSQGTQAAAFRHLLEGTTFAPGDVRQVSLGGGTVQDYEQAMQRIAALRGLDASSKEMERMRSIRDIMQQTQHMEIGSEDWNRFAREFKGDASLLEEAKIARRGGVATVVTKDAVRKVNDSMSDILRTVAELSDIFDTEDFDQLQANVEALGHGAIRDRKRAEEIRRHMERARATARMTGRDVKEVLADQGAIMQGLAPMYGGQRYVPVGVAESVQQAMFRNESRGNSLYTEQEAGANMARSLVDQARFVEGLAVARKYYADETAAGRDDAEMRSLGEFIKSAEQENDPYRQRAMSEEARSRAARAGLGWEMATDAQYAKVAQKEHGGPLAENALRKTLLQRFREAVTASLGQTGQMQGREAEAASALGSLAGLVGTDEELSSEAFRAAGMKGGFDRDAAFQELYDRIARDTGTSSAEVQSRLIGLQEITASLTPEQARKLQSTYEANMGHAGMSNMVSEREQAEQDAVALMGKIERASGGNFRAGLGGFSLEALLNGFLTTRTIDEEMAASAAVAEAARQHGGDLDKALAGMGGVNLGTLTENNGLGREAIARISSDADMLKATDMSATQLASSLEGPAGLKRFLDVMQRQGKTMAVTENGLVLVDSSIAREKQRHYSAMKAPVTGLEDLLAGRLRMTEDGKVGFIEGNMTLEDGLDKLVDSGDVGTAAEILRKGKEDTDKGIKDSAAAGAYRRFLARDAATMTDSLLKTAGEGQDRDRLAKKNGYESWEDLVRDLGRKSSWLKSGRDASGKAYTAEQFRAENQSRLDSLTSSLTRKQQDEVLGAGGERSRELLEKSGLVSPENASLDVAKKIYSLLEEAVNSGIRVRFM